LSKYLTRKPTQTLTADQKKAAQTLAVLNGVTFGLGDEIAALMESATSAKTYDQSFKENHDLLRQYRMENPKQDLAIEFFSGIPTGGLLGRAFGALGPISKRGGGGIARRLNRTVTAGAAGGGFAGFAEGGDLEERAQGAKTGALFGALLGIGAPAAAAAVKGVPAPAYRALENAARRARGLPAITSKQRAEAYVTEQMLRDNPKIAGKIVDAIEADDLEGLGKLLGVNPNDFKSIAKGVGTKSNPITAWDSMRSAANNPGRAKVSLADAFGASTKEATRVVALSKRGGSGKAARYFGSRQSNQAQRLRVATDRQFLPRRAERRTIGAHIAASQRRSARYMEKADVQGAGSRTLNSVVRDEGIQSTFQKHSIDYKGGVTTVGNLRQIRDQIDTALEGVTDAAERAQLQRAKKAVERELNRNTWYKRAMDASPGEDRIRAAHQAGFDHNLKEIKRLRTSGTEAERQASLIGVTDRAKRDYGQAQGVGNDVVKQAFGDDSKALSAFGLASRRGEDYNQFLRVVYNEGKLGKTFKDIYGDTGAVREAVLKKDAGALQSAARAAEPLHKKFYRWWQIYSRGLSPGVRHEMSKLLLPRSEHQMAQILGRTLLNPASVSKAERKLISDLMLDLGLASSAGAASSREYEE